MTDDATVTGFLASLDQTQYLPPDRLRAYQHRLLDRLLRHARSETGFYRDRLQAVFRADDTIDWDRWREIPILTRPEAQENEDALTARTLPQAAGRRIAQTTSGSTARPFRHFNTDIQNVASACANERFFRWHGIDPMALAAIVYDAHPPEDYAWPEGRLTTGWRSGAPNSPLVGLTIETPVHLQVEWLRRKRPAHLTTFPSNLREIARIAAEEGAPLAFDAVLSVGETLSPTARSEIRTAFGVEPLDRYGSTEIGHIAATCPHSLMHHISAELVLIEIVDENDNPVPPGTSGRIVATSFYNLATPMIRYDMGDYGVLSPELCGCGRTLPLLERILGRSRNIFRFADGTSLWPVVESADMLPLIPHRRFQFVQVTPERIEFRYVPVAPDQYNDIDGATALIRRRLHPSVTVDFVPVAALDRAAGGKLEDYVSLVAEP